LKESEKSPPRRLGRRRAIDCLGSLPTLGQEGTFVVAERSRDQLHVLARGLSRRAAFGRLAAGGIGAALWTAVERGSVSSNAQATPEPECVEPNLFQFVGEETQITYNALTSNLTYEDPRGSLTYDGDEIRTLGTPLGLLVTVHVASGVYGDFVELTLVLPEILHPSKDAPPTSFTTVAVLMTYWPIIGCRFTVGIFPPFSGAQRRYEFVALEGTAQFIES
jgi:hypothetical protein